MAAEPAPRPLRIERFTAHGFRNLEPLELEPGPRFNVIHGDNGAGKSNLLEGLHYVAALRSFRGARAVELVGTNAEGAALEAKVSGGDALPRRFRITFGGGRSRRLQLDGKRPRSIAQWHAALQIVLFHPGDLTLASGPPEGRRSYLDRILEQMDPTYSSTLASYTRALRSRNRLLREGTPDRRSIGAFDEVLASAGAVVGQTRAELVQDLAPRAQKAFADVAGQELPLDVDYRPRVDPEASTLRRALQQAYDKDVARGFTAEGPHADDLALEVRGFRARHHASQGQQRAIVLALKVAELDVLASRVRRVPILLLDDVSSELDRTRNQRLFEVLAGLGSQVFLTTTHPEFILLDRDRTDLHVERGRVHGAGKSGDEKGARGPAAGG